MWFLSVNIMSCCSNHSLSKNRREKRKHFLVGEPGKCHLTQVTSVDSVLDKHPCQGTAGGAPTCTLLIMRKVSSEPNLGLLYEQTGQLSTKNLREENQGKPRNQRRWRRPDWRDAMSSVTLGRIPGQNEETGVPVPISCRSLSVHLVFGNTVPSSSYMGTRLTCTT